MQLNPLDGICAADSRRGRVAFNNATGSDDGDLRVTLNAPYIKRLYNLEFSYIPDQPPFFVSNNNFRFFPGIFVGRVLVIRGDLKEAIYNWDSNAAISDDKILADFFTNDFTATQLTFPNPIQVDEAEKLNIVVCNPYYASNSVKFFPVVSYNVWLHPSGTQAPGIPPGLGPNLSIPR